MNATIDLAPILDLPVPERIDVVQTILDSITSDICEPEMSEELKAELARRLADYRADPSNGVPWEQVRDAALARRRDL